MATSSTNDYAATGYDCESKEWLEAKVTNGFTRVYAEGSLGAVAGLTYTVLSAPTVGSPMSGRVIISETAASVGGEGGPLLRALVRILPSASLGRAPTCNTA